MSDDACRHSASTTATAATMTAASAGAAVAAGRRSAGDSLAAKSTGTAGLSLSARTARASVAALAAHDRAVGNGDRGIPCIDADAGAPTAATAAACSWRATRAAPATARPIGIDGNDIIAAATATAAAAGTREARGT
ncbi:MAG: hypothetical protein KAX84_12260, partial [Burkholderiales bacterium]|nr:hypothetical protein [Burkholderiales bacterium]